MKQLFLYLTVFVSVFLSGCATSPKDWFAPGNPIAEITVQAASLKYIDGDQDKAVGLKDFAVRGKTYLDGNPQARAAEAVVFFKSLVPWEKLDEAETLLAISAFTVIQNELEARIEDGGLNADTRIYLSDMLDWVIRTCEAYIEAPGQTTMWMEGHRAAPLLMATGDSLRGAVL